MKKLLVFILSLTLLVALAACATDDPVPADPGNGETPEVSDEPADDPADDGDEPEEPPAGDLPIIGTGAITYDPNIPVNNGEEITITLWTWAYVEWIEEAMDAYMAIHPNVTVDIVITPWSDYFTRLPVALHAGTGPDIFMPHIQYTSILRPNMAPYSLGGISNEDLLTDFRTAGNHISDGEIYWIDQGIIMSAIIYNKDMWADAGLTDDDIPITWDELIEVAQLLTEFNDNGDIEVQGFSPNGAVFDLWKDLVLQQGHFLFNAEGTAPHINTPAGIAASQLIYDMYYVHEIADIRFPEGWQALGNNDAAMIYSFSWLFPLLDYMFPDLNYGYFNMPAFTEDVPPAFGRLSGEASLGVPAIADPEVQAVAFDIVRFTLANDELLIRYNLLQRNVPTKFTIENDPRLLADDMIAGQLSIIERILYVGDIPAAYQHALPRFVEEAILLNREPIADVLETAQEVITRDMVGQEFYSLERHYRFADEMSD